MVWCTVGGRSEPAELEGIRPCVCPSIRCPSNRARASRGPGAGAGWQPGRAGARARAHAGGGECARAGGRTRAGGSGVLRPHAEDAFAAELAALAAQDDRPRPARWRLSPWAVATYLLGGTLPDGTVITPKYVGPRRIVEVAVTTLATDRALLLLGVPGTAKTWCPSISRRPSAATRRWSCRARPGPRRSRSATAGTTHNCSRTARARTRWCPAPSCGPCARGRSPGSRS